MAKALLLCVKMFVCSSTRGSRALWECEASAEGTGDRGDTEADDCGVSPGLTLESGLEPTEICLRLKVCATTGHHSPGKAASFLSQLVWPLCLGIPGNA